MVYANDSKSFGGNPVEVRVLSRALMNRNNSLNPNKELQAYIIGVAIGDGNLSNPNGRAVRLRVTCDKKYPLLIKKIKNSLSKLFPNNKIGIVDRAETFLDISVYSNNLEELLGWKAKGGSKAVQGVSISAWILDDEKYKIGCIRGLVETDGAVYFDRGYKMVIFKTIIPKLANDFHNAVLSLGFNSRMYKVEKNENGYVNQKTAYHVRLSKNVQEFLDLVKIEKS